MNRIRQSGATRLHLGVLGFALSFAFNVLGELPGPGVPGVPGPGVPGVPGVPGPGVPGVPGPVNPPVPNPGNPPIVTPAPVPAVPGFKPGNPVGVIGGQPIQKTEPVSVVRHTRPSHLEQADTQKNLNAAKAYATKVWNEHSDLRARLDLDRNSYYRNSLNRARAQYNRVRNYSQNSYYKYYYSAWHKVGFISGYFHPVRFAQDVYNYFGYPMVRWLYVKAVDPALLTVWYADDLAKYPYNELSHLGCFLPTDTLRDLAKDLNGREVEAQANFRAGMEILGTELSAQISEHLVASYALAENDIVINQYQNLGSEAVVLTGFVDRANLHVAFKALIDLTDSSKTVVFVPRAYQPDNADLSRLEAINDRMKAAGLDPLQAQLEPRS